MPELITDKERRKWEIGLSVCSRCNRDVSNKNFFSGGHARGSCSPNLLPSFMRDYYKQKRKEKRMEIAAEKFEALGADVPTIPQPTEIVPQGYAERWRVAVQTITDVEVVEEAQRRLLALERYVKDKGRQDEVRAACRWCELRIGELLGPPERGGDRRSEDFKSSAVDLNANERVWFRSMAENREVVQQCIEDGKTSRSAILSEIKTVNGIVNGKEWTLEAALRRIEAAIKAETREASGADYVAMGEWLAKLGEQMKSTRTMDLVAGRCETTGDNILTVVADNIKASEPNGCDLLKDRELAGR